MVVFKRLSVADRDAVTTGWFGIFSRECSFRSVRGASLVEVLTALVVVLLGVTAVISIFPKGIGTIQAGADITVANRLAQSELDRVRGRAINLPEGILAVDPDGNVKLDILPGDMDVLSGLDPAVNAYYYTDLNKFRRVKGEITDIPVPRSDTWDEGSIYVLTLTPISYDSANPDSVVIYSRPLRRENFNSDLIEMDIGDFHAYAVDLDNDKVYVKKATFDRVFFLSYSYWVRPASDATRPERFFVKDEVVQLNTGVGDVTGTNLQEVTCFASVPVNGEVELGSVTLKRRFENLTGTGNPFSAADPYQFSMKNAVAGVIAFNPLGYDYYEVTAQGRQRLIANIDYNMLDWHVIREERKVPEKIDDDVYVKTRLSLSYVKQKDVTPEADGSIYGGLAPDLSVDADVMAIDKDTGEVYYNTTEISPGVPALKVDYKNGIVEFHPTLAGETGRTGKTYEICYMSDRDWAVQVFKSFNEYQGTNDYTNLKPDGPEYFTNPANPTAGWYLYYFVDDSVASGDVPEGARYGMVYFPRCYAGMSVAIDYSYTVDGVPYKVTGDSFRISDGYSEVGPSGDSYKLCYADILSRLEEQLTGGSTIVVTDVSNVYGVSVGSRVIWRNAGTGFLAGRWRKVESQTYLTRAVN